MKNALSCDVGTEHRTHLRAVADVADPLVGSKKETNRTGPAGVSELKRPYDGVDAVRIPITRSR